MAKFVPIFVALIIAALFAVSIIIAGMSLTEQNRGTVNLRDDESFSEFYSAVYDSLLDAGSSTTSSSQSMTNSTVSSTGTIPYMTTLGGIWKVLINTPNTIWNLITGVLFDFLFGSEQARIITIALGAILTIILISAIVLWIMWGQGG